jgi:hypothetical protein
VTRRNRVKGKAMSAKQRCTPAGSCSCTVDGRGGLSAGSAKAVLRCWHVGGYQRVILPCLHTFARHAAGTAAILLWRPGFTCCGSCAGVADHTCRPQGSIMCLWCTGACASRLTAAQAPPQRLQLTYTEPVIAT